MWQSIRKKYDDLFTPEEEKAKRYKNKFTEAFSKFPVKPLTTEEELKFYVSLTGDIFKDFQAYLNLNQDTGKYLVTGQNGCGKTTELHYWGSKLDENYTVIMCSLLNIAEENEADVKDILLLIGIRLIQVLVEMDLAASVGKSIEFFYQLLEQNVNHEDPEQLSSDLNLLCLKMKSEPVSRKTIREKMETNLALVYKAIDSAAQELWQATDKQPIVIIDDMEKLALEPAVEIFYQNKDKLLTPVCRIIYTMPLMLYYSDQFIYFRNKFADYFPLPLVRIYDKDNKEFGKGMDLFDKLVNKRIKAADHFEEEVLNDLIIRTGGNVTDLIRLVQECCFMRIQKPKAKIDREVLDAVMKKWKQKIYKLLDPKSRSILKKVYLTKQFDQDKLAYFYLFLNEKLILEQQDHDEWFDIHPVLRELLGLPEEPGFED